MKIGVLVKRTPDTEAKINLNSDKKEIDHSGMKFVINPYDEFALEEAMLLKAKNDGSEVVVVCVGESAAKEIIVKALAFGADKAIHIETTGKVASSLETASVLSKVIKEESFDVVFAGRHGIDEDNMHTAAMTAELSGIPFVNTAVKVDYSEGNKFKVERAVEGGMVEVYEATGPLIIGCDKALNKPRYASLPNIMKAKKKPIDVKAFADLVESTGDSGITLESFEFPPEKSECVIFEGDDIPKLVGDLIDKLKNEAKVIG